MLSCHHRADSRWRPFHDRQTSLDARRDRPRHAPADGFCRDGGGRKRRAAAPATRRCMAGRSTGATRSGSGVWDFCGVVATTGDTVIVRPRHAAARFFPEATLNFAENLLRRGDAAAAPSSSAARTGASRGCQLRGAARPRSSRLARRRCAAAGRRRRRPGRRHPAEHARGRHRHAGGDEHRRDLVVLLAGLRRQGVLDRFGQIEPKVLFAADGYFYDGKRIDIAGQARARSLPQLPRVATHGRRALCRATSSPPAVPRRGHAGRLRRRRSRRARSRFERLPFDHPLYILYSSGTTGVPKCIVHGAGGTLLQHLKEHRLHSDLRRERPAVLLHDLRLDDVELAGRRRSPPAPRCCSTTARPFHPGRQRRCSTSPRPRA